VNVRIRLIAGIILFAGATTLAASSARAGDTGTNVTQQGVAGALLGLVAPPRAEKVEQTAAPAPPATAPALQGPETPPAPAAPTTPLRDAMSAAVDSVVGTRLPPMKSNVPNAAVWGPMAQLGGSYWLYEPAGEVLEYRWRIPGEVLESSGHLLEGDASETLTLDATGTQIVGSVTKLDGNKEAYVATSPRAGVVVATASSGRWRDTTRYAGDRAVSQAEVPDGGNWQALGEMQTGRRISAAQAQVALATLEPYRVARAAEIAQNKARWGVLLDKVGNTYVRNVDGHNWLYRYAWTVPGARLQEYTREWGQKTGTAYEYVWDNANRRVVWGAQGGPIETYYVAQPDGSLIGVRVDPKSARDTQFLVKHEPDGTGVWITEKRQGGTWVVKETARYGAYTAAVEAQLVQQAQAQRAQQAAQAEEDDSGGGLLGALTMGAGAALGGGDASQVLGAAAQGASMADPGSGAANILGAAAGTTGAPQMDVAGALMGNAAAGASSMAGGGSYPTKPNLAVGYCPGFTEGNYRQVALGGDDQQRNTLCGGAFEYYTMYKRAIAQGYSEADANRTYAAHEGAVANLRTLGR
jgi:hypothetical protein